VVNSAQDVAAPPAGVVTLRSALQAANATPGPNTITFNPSLAGQTITLTGALPTINQGTLNIVGPGANLLTVSGNNAFQVFNFSRLPQVPHWPPPPPPPVVAISGLTITGGAVQAGPSLGLGAGIFNQGDLTLDGVVVTGNNVSGWGGSGGGIASLGPLTVIDSIISSNSAEYGGGIWAGPAASIVRSTIMANLATYYGEGGGIYNGGQMAITDSTVSNNLAVSAAPWTGPFTGGGGIFTSGVLTLTRCTVSGNQTEGLGGGVWAQRMAVATVTTINDSTIANNVSFGTSPSSGGGGVVQLNDTLAINDSTITGNSDATGSAGGINVGSSYVTFRLNNSVVAGNSSADGAAPDIRGAVASGGGNFIGVGDANLTGIADGSGGNRVGTPPAPLDPPLGPLQNNGGPTLTRAPLPGSPLLDAGVTALVPAGLSTDQRGLARVVGAAVDVGAVEAQAQAGVGAFDPATATWYLRSGVGAGAPDAGEFAYGGAGWLPAAGDWAGSGQAGIGVFDPSTATWCLRNEAIAGAPDAGVFQYGGAGWVPLAGDWNNSGQAGIGAFDPQTATWYLRNEASAGAPDAGEFRFGVAGGVPVVGDWAGTGHLGIGVFDPATATWYLRSSATPGAPDAGVFQYGGAGFRPVAGDWAGSGHAGIGVTDPSTGMWYLRNEPGAGAPDAGQFGYGGAGWLPVAGAFVAPGGAGSSPMAAEQLSSIVTALLAGQKHDRP
jgi:hypothetical protein